MNKRESFLKELELGLTQINDPNLKEIIFQKDQEIILSNFYIILKGSVEVFIKGNHGRHIILGVFSDKDTFIGGLIYLWEHFNKHNITLFFKSKSNVILKQILKNNTETISHGLNNNNFLYKIFLKKCNKTNSGFPSQNLFNNHELIKILLKKDADIQNIIEIDAILNFTKKYNINCSAFYKGINILEERKQIKKYRGKIKILEWVLNFILNFFIKKYKLLEKKYIIL